MAAARIKTHAGLSNFAIGRWVPCFCELKANRLPGLLLLTRLVFSFSVSLLAAACTCINSVGFRGDLPWNGGQVPTVSCYCEAYQCVPPFVYWRWDQVPKRAILEVALWDIHLQKMVLDYDGKLKAHPEKLEIHTPSLVGDLLTVSVTDRATHESWVIEFQRGADGQFRVIREQGAFRK